MSISATTAVAVKTLPAASIESQKNSDELISPTLRRREWEELLKNLPSSDSLVPIIAQISQALAPKEIRRWTREETIAQLHVRGCTLLPDGTIQRDYHW